MEMIIIYIEIYAILALALNLQLGMTGLMNFSIGIFYGFSAYIFAMTTLYWKFNFYEALASAIVCNMLLSIPVSLASVRFKGEIFVLVTLAFQIISLAIIGNMVATGGQFGLTNIPQYNFFGTTDMIFQIMIVGAIVTSIIAAFSFVLYQLPFTRVLQAIRDDSTVAAALGKNIIWYKMQSVAISCGLTAFAGALLVSAVPALTLDSFDINVSIDIILILVFGGLGNVRGAIIGSLSFHILEHFFREIDLGQLLNRLLINFDIVLKSGSVEANLRLILFCVALIIVLYFRPQGLAGKLKIND
jgi:branched-chain amino acid transport system permease protein